MPYKSRAQAGYFHTHKAQLEAQGVNVSEWDSASSGKSLPYQVAKKADGGASDDGSNPWDQLPRSAEGIPRLSVTKQPYDILRDKAQSLFSSPEPLPPIPERSIGQNPYSADPNPMSTEQAKSWRDLIDPFAKNEEGQYVADQPLKPNEQGKVPAAIKDPTSFYAPIAAEAASMLPIPGPEALIAGAKPMMAMAASAARRIARPAINREVEQAVGYLSHHFNMPPSQVMNDWTYSNPKDYVRLADYYRNESAARNLTPSQVRAADKMEVANFFENPTKSEQSKIPTQELKPNTYDGELARIHSTMNNPEHSAAWERFADTLSQRGFNPKRDLPDLLRNGVLGNTPEAIASSLYTMARSHPELANEILNSLPDKMLRKVDGLIGRYGSDVGHHPFMEWKEWKEKENSYNDYIEKSMAETKPKEPDDHEVFGVSEPEWRPGQSDLDALEELLAGHHAGPEEYVPPAPRQLSQEDKRQLGLLKTYQTHSGLNYDRIGRNAVPFLESKVLPHYNGNINEFLDHFFAGTFNKEGHDSTIRVTYDGNGIFATNGPILDPRTKEPIPRSAITRSFYWNGDRNYVSHDYFRVPPIAQASGIATSVLRNQFELYRKMGLDFVDLHANLEVGGYAWAKYGFSPRERDWVDVANRAGQIAINEVRAGRMSPAMARDVHRILTNRDPRSIWNLSDIEAKSPYVLDNGKPEKWGQFLLAGSDWFGKFDLKDPSALSRFDAYVSKKK